MGRSRRRFRCRAVPRIRLVRAPPRQKTPRRGGEAFLGLLQGGEICISIYVDPWEVGEPLMCRGRSRWESTAYMSGAGPNQEDRCSAFHRVSHGILESRYEHTCDLCVRRVTEPCLAVSWAASAILLPNSKVSVNIW